MYLLSCPPVFSHMDDLALLSPIAHRLAELSRNMRDVCTRQGRGLGAGMHFPSPCTGREKSISWQVQDSNRHLHQVRKAAQAEGGCGRTSGKMFQVLKETAFPPQFWQLPVGGAVALGMGPPGQGASPFIVMLFRNPMVTISGE